MVLCSRCFGVEVESLRSFFGYTKGQNTRPLSIIFFVQNLDFGIPGSPFGLHFGTRGHHFGVFLEALTPLGDHSGTFGVRCRVWRPRGRFFIDFWVSGGSLWSSVFFSSYFLMSKWELRLWTSFLVHFRRKKGLKTVALCC